MGESVSESDSPLKTIQFRIARVDRIWSVKPQNMKIPTWLLILSVFAVIPYGATTLLAEEEVRLAELDKYWEEVSRSVGEGDFEAYAATCHPEGVLVSGVRGNSSPLADALKRWKKEFDATKAGEMKAGVT